MATRRAGGGGAAGGGYGGGAAAHHAAQGAAGVGPGPGGVHPGAAGTVETEIERAREDGNWKRVLHLAEQLKIRPDRQFETLGNFLIGEAKLEDFLEEHPPKEKNTAHVRRNNSNCRAIFMACECMFASALITPINSKIA